MKRKVLGRDALKIAEEKKIMALVWSQQSDMMTQGRFQGDKNVMCRSVSQEQDRTTRGLVNKAVGGNGVEPNHTELTITQRKGS